MEADMQKRREQVRARRRVSERFLSYFRRLQRDMAEDSERFLQQVMEQHRASEDARPH
jgi:hypothetical protein